MKQTRIIAICIVSLLIGGHSLHGQMDWSEIGSNVYYQLKNPPLNNVFALGRDTVFLIGDDGYVTRSLNGLTQSVTTTSVPSKTKLMAIHFRNHLEGYISGHQHIYRTLDGGDSWELVYSRPPHDFNSVCCVGETDTWAVTSHGLVIRSQDSGDTWQEVDELKSNVVLTGVSFNNKGVGMITGRDKTLLMTSDYGKTWSRDNDILSRVQFRTPQVGDSVAIYSSNMYYYYLNLNTKELNSQEVVSTEDFHACLKNDTTVVCGKWESTGMAGLGGEYAIWSDQWYDDTFLMRSQHRIHNYAPEFYVRMNYVKIHYGDQNTGYMTRHKYLLRTELVEETQSIDKTERSGNSIKHHLKGVHLMISGMDNSIDRIIGYSAIGGEIFDAAAAGDCAKIDISKFPKGIYIVNLLSDNHRIQTIKISVP